MLFRGQAIETIRIILPKIPRVLFSFPSLPTILFSDSRLQHGVPHQLGLDACGLLFPGPAAPSTYLSLDVKGEVKVHPTTRVLGPGDYFLQLDGSTPCQTTAQLNSLAECLLSSNARHYFRSWSFPNSIPPHWILKKNSFNLLGVQLRVAQRKKKHLSQCLGAKMATFVNEDDPDCVLTHRHSGCQIAHLIPKAESRWFTENDMKRFNCFQSAGVNDMGNGIKLRAGLHQIFD